MRFTLKVFIALVISGFAYALWVVQPDRLSLKQIERNIAAAQFSEVEELLNAFGFTSETLTYFALAERFSRGDGIHPLVLMNPDIRQEFQSLCAIKCQLTVSKKSEKVPLIGMHRQYKFFVISTGETSTHVLRDHAFWMMLLP